MKELSIEEKAHRYDEALNIAKSKFWEVNKPDIDEDDMIEIFPELKNQDERIRNEIRRIVDIWTNSSSISNGIPREALLDWIDKLKWDDDEKWNEDERLRWQTLEILNYYKDKEKSEGRMPTEIEECITWFEKQGEQRPANKPYTFKAIPRILEMVDTSDRLKSYCQKLIESLMKEGYEEDAKIVEERIKQINGEDVAMATMDEKIPDEPTWCDEDDEMIYKLLDFFRWNGNARFNKEECDAVLEWLKRLNHRLHWKPSKEQMNYP